MRGRNVVDTVEEVGEEKTCPHVIRVSRPGAEHDVGGKVGGQGRLEGCSTRIQQQQRPSACLDQPREGPLLWLDAGTSPTGRQRSPAQRS